MKSLKKILTFLLPVLVLFAIYTEASELANEPFAKLDLMRQELDGTCSYPVLEKYQDDHTLICQLDALRQRCNKIDDCYVYCIGRDVGEGIGGGCAHICNYALRENWVPPERAKACLKK